MIFLFTFILLLSISEVYSFKGYQKSLSIARHKLFISFAIINFLFIAGLALIAYKQWNNHTNSSVISNLLTGILFAIFLFFLVSTILFFVEDIFRFLKWVFLFITKKNQLGYPKRTKPLGLSAAIWGLLMFMLVVYGMLFGFTHYKVHHVDFVHIDVPESFNGFKIAQISDIHLGTFGNKKQVEKGLNKLMDQKPDMIVFTGDMVNNYSSEALDYIDLFKKLEAPFGKYAIMGNHDYAHYAYKLTKKEQNEDTQKLRQVIEQMGFTILSNSNEIIFRNADSIILAGVENWGNAPFPQYGELETALNNIDSASFVLLLSHDPSHWSQKVLSFKLPIALTLSGHTHGMQFGFELGNKKWSPVQYIYPNWAGMYQRGKQHLYVNRGFGCIGFPGRVGIRPEITLIELKK